MFGAGSRLYPLDEPFVGIDSVSEEIIMNTLRDLKKAGKTVLIVHHDLSKVPHYFDQVLLVNREVIVLWSNQRNLYRSQSQRSLR